MVERRYPLAGLRIVEILGGPLGPATRTLAELGAEVVHIAAPDQPERLDEVDPRSRAGLRLLADHAGKPFPHIFRSIFCEGETEYVSGEIICFLQNIGNSCSEELSFSTSWSSNHENRAIDGIYGFFLFRIELIIAFDK